MLVDGKNFFADGQLSKDQKIPILVMFSEPYCPYCELVKREVLNSMSELEEYKKKVIIRHIFYSSLTDIKNFQDENSNQSKFAFKYGAKFFPTLMLLDGDGNILEKKVGVVLIENYWTELDELIQSATQMIQNTTQPAQNPIREKREFDF
jgi:thioredoxin-related protein